MRVPALGDLFGAGFSGWSLASFNSSLAFFLKSPLSVNPLFGDDLLQGLPHKAINRKNEEKNEEKSGLTHQMTLRDLKKTSPLRRPWQEVEPQQREIQVSWEMNWRSGFHWR